MLIDTSFSVLTADFIAAFVEYAGLFSWQCFIVTLLPLAPMSIASLVFVSSLRMTRVASVDFGDEKGGVVEVDRRNWCYWDGFIQEKASKWKEVWVTVDGLRETKPPARCIFSTH